MDKEQLEKGLELAIDFNKRPEIHAGVVPVVVQSNRMHSVLLLGYAAPNHFESTLLSRQSVLVDLEGNPIECGRGLSVVNMHVDCDQDALVYQVNGQNQTRFSRRVRRSSEPGIEEGVLVPAIAQDYLSGDVLMLGYANRLAVETALKKGMATFWSTSRDELWTKGETSGDFLKLSETYHQEDGSVLYLVQMAGAGACHTKTKGEAARKSCFYRRITPLGGLEFLPGME